MFQFTDAQMIEIGRVRERLEAYRNKVQPYFLDDPEELSEPKKAMEWSTRQWDAVKQLKALVLHLQEKIIEKPKPTKGKSKYT